MLSSPYAEKSAALPRVVAVDLHLLSPGGGNGGVKPMIYGLLGRLSRRWAGKITFKVLANRLLADEVSSEFGAENICVVRRLPLPLDCRPNQRQPLRVRWILRNVDLLYAPVWFSPFHSTARPTIALMVDMLHWDHPEMLSGEEERRWREEIIHFSAATASRVQTISKTMAERVREYCGISEERLFTTYLPLQARFDGSSVTGTSPICGEYFIYPANLWTHKNHERLLAGFAEYRRRAGPTAWSLKLTGHHHTERRAVLEAQMDRLGLAFEDVQFLGFLDETAFGMAWQMAGAMVFPSLYEGFGMPLLEAMHFEVPIAASRIASIPEIAGDAALFFDPYDPHAIADAMFRLSTEPDLRNDLVKKGTERLRTFDADKEADKLAETFLTVIEEFKAGNR